MLDIPINVWVVDSKTLVGERFIEIRLYDKMIPSDIILLVELIRSYFIMTQSIKLEEMVEDIRVFFSSRSYAAKVEKTMSNFNCDIVMNILGNRKKTNLSLQVLNNIEMKDVHMWEDDAISELEYMLC